VLFAVCAVSGSHAVPASLALCSLPETPECPVFLASGTTAVIVVPRAVERISRRPPICRSR
jgi:hypothetical protein